MNENKIHSKAFLLSVILSTRPEKRTVNQILDLGEILEVILLINQSNKFFQPFSKTPDYKKICKLIKLVTFNPETYIFVEGDESDKVYVILKGIVKVFINVKTNMVEQRKLVAKLKSGDYFGEISILNDSPRTATTIAEDIVECIEIDRRHFDLYIKVLLS